MQRRLSPTEVNELIGAYRAGATLTELAHRFRLHRITVVAHLDRHHIERHDMGKTWDAETLATAAAQYAAGASLAALGANHGIDARTIANRFRKAGIPIRPRRGWHPRHPH